MHTTWLSANVFNGPIQAGGIDMGGVDVVMGLHPLVCANLCRPAQAPATLLSPPLHPRLRWFRESKFIYNKLKYDWKVLKILYACGGDEYGHRQFAMYVYLYGLQIMLFFVRIMCRFSL
jgi:hypothetical protein